MDSTAATTTIVDSGTATVSVGAATAAEGDDVEFVVTLSMAAGSDVEPRLEHRRRHRDLR